jgi:hypothetical protein
VKIVVFHFEKRAEPPLAETSAASYLKLELNADLQSIFASIRGSLPENTAAGQPPFRGTIPCPKKFRQNYVSYKSSAPFVVYTVQTRFSFRATISGS